MLLIFFLGCIIPSVKKYYFFIDREFVNIFYELTQINFLFVTQPSLFIKYVNNKEKVYSLLVQCTANFGATFCMKYKRLVSVRAILNAPIIDDIKMLLYHKGFQG